MTPTPSPTLSLDQLWQAPTVYRSDLLANQVAIVSGGGTGIGRTIALLLARLGAKVAICGRTLERLAPVAAFAQGKGATVIAVPTDIRNQEQIEALQVRVERELGPLDLLVNNAGGQFPQAAIDFTAKGFNAVVENNLHGTFFMMQAAARRFRAAARPGTLVNIVAVVEKGMPGVAHTAAARAGVIALSKTVAVEWAPLSIRVNCLAPGTIATEGLGVYPPDAVREFGRSNPMLRMGEPWDVAEACVYLGSAASKFVTGEVLTVDGGGRLWGELWTHGKPEYFR